MLAGIGRGNPYATLVATILSARVRDEMTDRILPEVLCRWPDADSLSRAEPQEIENVIRKIGLYRTKSKRLVNVGKALVRDHQGTVPDNMEDLIKLPGVGRKTAGCVVVYAFGGDALPVDTHVHRISNRMGWINTTNPSASEKALYRVVPQEWWSRVNDLLVYHGKNTCLPIHPRCHQCPVADKCPWPMQTKERAPLKRDTSVL